jgi:hypothetical protein
MWGYGDRLVKMEDGRVISDERQAAFEDRSLAGAVA